MSSLAAFAAKLGLLAILISSLAFAFAQQGGTTAEAKAMLEKALAAVKSDKTKALNEFNTAEGGFREGDLISAVVPLCLLAARSQL